MIRVLPVRHGHLGIGYFIFGVLGLLACFSTQAVGNKTSDVMHSHYIDCSASATGDGSRLHPWNSLQAAQSHVFAPGDLIALARGSECQGTFAPQGSGTKGMPIRLTSYGTGKRPRIVAPSAARQALLLFNQEYWQIDSLDISGGNTYGVFVSGDKGLLHHLYLKNLYVHDVFGGELTNKDNGLVVVGPSGPSARFEDVLVDGVDAAHSNQWAGILVGGGNFAFPENAPLNRNIVIVNSTVHDVFGDGIILFRDEQSAIKTSAAWQTGMQPTQDVGTPNAIWTWTCSDCVVEDNESYLTDSPGIDGGAYDIDWDNTRNVVQRNYAHDTQGYCIAVFAAGYTTADSIVRDNVCIDNGLSPRLSLLQGAIYIHTWNSGPIRGLMIERNTVRWNPPVPEAAAIVNDALIQGSPAMFRHNRIESSAPLIYRGNAQLDFVENTYAAAREPLFTLGELHNASLSILQAAGKEAGSKLLPYPDPNPDQHALRIHAYMQPAFDDDGLLESSLRAQLIGLRNLAGQYGPNALTVTVHLANTSKHDELSNALVDLEDVYPGSLLLDPNSDVSHPSGTILLQSPGLKQIKKWHGFQNAATLGAAVRDRLGAPQYSHAQTLHPSKQSK